MTVVTGAAGHVGANLCVELRRAGHVVRAVDVRRPVRALRCGAEWHRADIRDAKAIERVLDGCDVVYHLASIISVVAMGTFIRSTLMARAFWPRSHGDNG